VHLKDTDQQGPLAPCGRIPSISAMFSSRRSQEQLL
jgi:hypothetical protein